MTAADRTIETWLSTMDAGIARQAEWLADQVRASQADLDEAIKWRRLTFTEGGDWRHWLCAVAASKGGAGLVFHKGALLADPEGLLEGDDRYIRRIPHRTVVEHPDAVVALVRDALAHRTDMLG